MTERPLEQLNQAEKRTFVDVLGSIYENSPWVAARSWSERPFSSVGELQETMERTVEDASREKKLELLRAHPDLGENTEMTDASKEEQASAGLDDLSPELYDAFQRLNEEYQSKFGFPFIMSVKDERAEVIKEAMEGRVENSKSDEFRTALNEVHEIAEIRLEELLNS
jgi:2-oxo-4-hydroxy-4-carboxy-5-ureidoimidazoline decarboxylase